jgi:hypothetical protein
LSLAEATVMVAFVIVAFIVIVKKWALANGLDESQSKFVKFFEVDAKKLCL